MIVSSGYMIHLLHGGSSEVSGPNLLNVDPLLLCSSLQSSNLVSSLPKYNRSPSRRSRSRWEPLPEEKPVEKQASANNDSLKFSWVHVINKERKVIIFSSFPFYSFLERSNCLTIDVYFIYNFSI